MFLFFFFSSRRRHTRFDCDWSSDVCSSDLPFLGRLCVGKRALLVAEQLALEERLRDGGAVDLHEREVAPRALVVQATRHELFPRSAVALDQDRLRLTPCDLADEVAEVTGGLGATDELVDPVLVLLQAVP